MRHFSMSQSAVASLKMFSIEMVALAIEFAASFSSFSRSCTASAADEFRSREYTDVLGNSFEVAKGTTHGGTDVFFAHHDLLGQTSQSFMDRKACWAVLVGRHDNAEIGAMQTLCVSTCLMEMRLTSKI